MNSRFKIVLTAVLLCFVVVSVAVALVRQGNRASVNPAESASGAAPVAARRTMAYYFHGNVRCQSCLKIQNYSDEAIRTKFAEQLKAGTLEWSAVNVDEPANEHFIEDYKIVTKSVILVEMDGSRQLRWKNLDKVWGYLGNKDRFVEYVQGEVAGFLRGN